MLITNERFNKAIKTALVAVLALTIIFTPVSSAAATNKYKAPTELKNGYSKEIDLNGGKKEFLLASESIVNYESVYTLAIDGKPVLRKVGEASAWYFYVIDFNKKDKYKEILAIEVGGGGWGINKKVYIYRYNGKKLVPVKATFKLPKNQDYNAKYINAKFVIGYDIDKIETTGNGKFRTNIVTKITDSGTEPKLNYKTITYKITKAGKITRVK